MGKGKYLNSMVKVGLVGVLFANLGLAKGPAFSNEQAIVGLRFMNPTITKNEYIEATGKGLLKAFPEMTPEAADSMAAAMFSKRSVIGSSALSEGAIQQLSDALPKLPATADLMVVVDSMVKQKKDFVASTVLAVASAPTQENRPTVTLVGDLASLHKNPTVVAEKAKRVNLNLLSPTAREIFTAALTGTDNQATLARLVYINEGFEAGRGMCAKMGDAKAKASCNNGLTVGKSEAIGAKVGGVSLPSQDASAEFLHKLGARALDWEAQGGAVNDIVGEEGGHIVIMRMDDAKRSPEVKKCYLTGEAA